MRDKAATAVPLSVLDFHKVPRDIRFERIPAVRGAAAPASAQKPTEILAFLGISGHCHAAVDWPGPRRSKLGRVKSRRSADRGRSGIGRAWPARRGRGACPCCGNAGRREDWTSGLLTGVFGQLELPFLVVGPKVRCLFTIVGPSRSCQPSGQLETVPADDDAAGSSRHARPPG